MMKVFAVQPSTQKIDEEGEPLDLEGAAFAICSD